MKNNTGLAPRKTRYIAFSLIFTCLAGCMSAGVMLDLTATDGALSAVGGWTYNGAWSVEGQHLGATATLSTPMLTVAADGTVAGSFTHRFSFENRGDGGQIQYRVGSGLWNTIPQSLITGSVWTTYNAVLDLAAGSIIRDQYAFTGESINYSSGYVTSAFTLGTGMSPYQYGSAMAFVAGDQIQFQFLAAWDASSVWQNPNWQVTALSLENVSTGSVVPAVSESGSFWVAAEMGTVVLLMYRRRRRCIHQPSWLVP
jgi:hypothetical protein